MGTRYAIAFLPEGEAVPIMVEWSGNTPKKGSKMKLLQNGKVVKWEKEGNKVKLPACVFVE